MISELITFDEYSTYWIYKEGMCLESEGYVGVAKDAIKRWDRHKRSASNGSKYKIHNAIRKYNDDLKYIILATGTQDECLEFENFLRPTENIGWNLAAGGSVPPINKPTKEQAKIASDARIGTNHSKESKNKISENRKGKLTGKKHFASKKVLCIDTGEIFESGNIAAKHYGINQGNLAMVCRGERNVAGGKRWRYLDDK